MALGQANASGARLDAQPKAAGGDGSFSVSAPSLSLPNGGGAIRSIGEKFSASAARGTGTMSIPIAASPGRSGFGPALSLSYDSGAGNGTFGFGWSLGLPSITRKTEKGIPQYRDVIDSDVFVLAGAEDLVPVFRQAADGGWVRNAQGQPVVHEDEAGGFAIRRYRPRIEGLFARIERWTRIGAAHDVHWRTLSPDNVLTVYGRDADSRIADPADATRIFSWLVCESRDDKGNGIRYEYRREDGQGVDTTRVHERNRGTPDAVARTSNRYIKRILYGNRASLLVGGQRPLAFPAIDPDWMFELVFDYGEHDAAVPLPREDELRDAADKPVHPWATRVDAFSSYRAGFELRTSRLCRRVLMFHHFAGEPGVGRNCLVRSTEFTHSAATDPSDAQHPVYAFLEAVTHAGFRRNGAGYDRRSLPPLQFGYTRPVVQDTVEDIDPAQLENLPIGLDNTLYRWVDLHGEGVPGLLTEQAGAWWYKRNLSPLTDPGEGDAPAAAVRFAPLAPVQLRPNVAWSSGAEILDLASDGQPDVVLLEGATPGLYEHDEAQGWRDFRPFESRLTRGLRDPNVQFIDLDGDGRADILVTEEDAFVFHLSLGEAGFGPAARIAKALDDERGPRVVFGDGTQTVFLADLSGDGLTDIVRVRNGEVCYWPNLGHGRFGARVTMDAAPWFDEPDQYDPKRLVLADIDGSGTTDLVYLHREGVRLYFNQCGNSWSRPHVIRALARLGGAKVAAVDLLGNGTACLVWSSPLPADAGRQMRLVRLMGRDKPHLLVRAVNNLGAETLVEYAPSTKFFLQDERDGRPWLTRLPFPVHVVERVQTSDHVSGTRFVTRFAYHHGCYDGEEREFRGWGMVEQFDTESFVDHAAGVLAMGGSQSLEPELHQPPVTTRTWFHTGMWMGQDRVLHQYRQEYHDRLQHTPEPVLPRGLAPDELRECVRALKGMQLRQEIYSDDGSASSDRPYTITEAAYEVRQVQPRAQQRHGVFLALGRETVAINCERNLADPRVAHRFSLELDEYGNATQSCSIAYGRRQAAPGLPPEVVAAQQRTWVTYTQTSYTADLERGSPTQDYRLRVPCETRDFEITGLQPAGELFGLADLRARIALAADIAYEAIATGTTAQKRPIGCSRTVFLDNALQPMPLGQWDTLGIASQGFVLAFTPGVLAAQFAGQVTAAELQAAGYVHFAGDSNWWVPTGKPLYPADPVAAFYIPEGVRDPFGVETVGTYDAHHLLLRKVEVRQAAWNVMSAVNDYRVIGPVEVTDQNLNRSAVAHDELGMVVSTALMGKAGAGEGDTLADPTTRVEYELFNWMNQRQPNFAHSFTRERHGAANPRWQEAYVYSNGSGGVALMKAQAHAGEALQVQPDGTVTLVQADPRWVGSGRTVLNNKGKMVRQYEPYFSTTHAWENHAALRELGVSPVLWYDPLGRRVRTDFPNGSFARVEIGAWEHKSFDANDTVRESRWYADRGSPDPLQPEPLADPQRRAAWLAAQHAYTPGVTHFDSLGRRVYALTDFGAGRLAAMRSETDLTGRSTRLFDQHGREVASGFAAMGGIPMVADSAEKGRRYVLHDVLGALVRSWDAHGRQMRAVYDVLHRPVGVYVRDAGGPEVLHHYTVYGDRVNGAAALNLMGTTHLLFDQSGMVRVPQVDFKGNASAVDRILAKSYSTVLDWSALPAQPDAASVQASAQDTLEMSEVFTVSSEYDALNRPTRVVLADATEIVPTYTEANFLGVLRARLRGQGAWIEFLKGQDFDAKGQRQWAEHGNGVLTRYFYDPQTFRLERLLSTPAAGPQASALQDLKYTYDPVGNLAQIRDDAQQTYFFNNAVVAPESRYTYDAAYQLVRATGRELAGAGNDTLRMHTDLAAVSLPQANNASAVRTYTEEYDYDLLGNLREFRHRYKPQPGLGAGWTRRYRYAYDTLPGDRTNRLAATSLPGDPDAGPYSGTYTHDGYGNMTRMPHLPQLRWDAMDQLRSVDLGGGGVAWYVHDADGQRIRKVVERGANTRIERIYLGCVEIYRERTGAQPASLERFTLHIVDAGVRIAQVDIKTRDTGNSDPANPLGVPLVRYQHGNHAGSAVLETNDAGNVLSYEEFHPFGTSAYRSSRPGANLSLKRIRFAGRELDDETGFYYCGARYYAPWLGRWTSSDPGGFVDGPNLFRYCRNAPTTLNDPGGMQPTYLPGSAEGRLTPESTLADREAFAARFGRRIVDPHPEQHRWVGSRDRGHWELSAEGRFEPLPPPDPQAQDTGSPPLTTDTAQSSSVEVEVTPGGSTDANPGTTGASGGSDTSTGSTGGSGSGSGAEGEGAGGGGERSFFTSSFFRGLVVGLAITVAVVAVVATGGAALAVIAPGASAAIAASGIGTALAVGGTALTVANTVQSVRQRDLWNNPISEEEANYNLGLGIGAAAGGALARPVAGLGTGVGTSLGRGTTAAASSLSELLEGGTLVTSAGTTWGGTVTAPAISGVSGSTAVAIGGTSMGTTTALMRGHTADWELRGPDGRIETRGRLSSGSDTPPGRRLTWNEQLETHTERKIIDMLRGRVQPGDHITIRGTKPPCDPGGRGCGTAMQAFAEEMSIRITYTNTTTGQVWRYP